MRGARIRTCKEQESDLWLFPWGTGTCGHVWKGVLLSKCEAFEHGFNGFLCNEWGTFSLPLPLPLPLSIYLSNYLPIDLFIYLSFFLTRSRVHVTLGVVFKRLRQTCSKGAHARCEQIAQSLSQCRRIIWSLPWIGELIRLLIDFKKGNHLIRIKSSFFLPGRQELRKSKRTVLCSRG